MIAFNCSNCASPFKVSERMAGMKGKCPKCGTVNTVPAPAPTAAAPQAARAAVPAGHHATDEVEVVETVEVVEQVEVVEHVEVVEEVDVVDTVQVDDDQPARPRKKKGKGKKKKSKKLLIAGLVGGLVFLLLGCGGVGFAVWYFFFAGAGDEQKYLPDSSQLVATVNLEQLRDSDLYKRITKDIGTDAATSFTASSSGDLEDVGLKLEDIVRVTAGMDIEKDEGIVAFVTKNPVKVDDVLAAAKSKKKNVKEVKVGNTTTYEGVAGNQSVCFPEKKIILVGKPAVLKTVLERNGKPKFSTELKTAMGQTDFSKTVAVAVDVKGATSKSKGAGGRPAPGLPIPVFGAAGDWLGKIETVSLQVDVRSDVNVSVAVSFQDAKTAEDLKKKIDDLLKEAKKNAPAEAKDVLDWPITQSGNRISVSGTYKGDSAVKLAKDFKPVKGPPPVVTRPTPPRRSSPR